ncbi:unnamed protein product [Rotaria sp. Silwood1]|nr:unnamed protein product [Rotaria sp. Silwood1]CAF4906397.1 unnamed protein product [Rotaria sp. Silwood1]
MVVPMASDLPNRRKFIRFNSIHPSGYLHRWFTIHIRDQSVLQELASSRPHPETYPIADSSSLVFLIDFESNNRIRIWLKEQEVKVNKCSDYIYENYALNEMQPCWVCKWVDVPEYWFIDPNEEIDESTIEKPDFYRLHGDRNVRFGDGGEAFLVYPVWIHKQLPVSESRRKRLLSVLYKLNEERKDFHPSPSPVEDIIDPDLLPFRPSSTYDRNQWIARNLRKLQKSEYKTRHFKRDLDRGAYNDFSEHETLRNCYQWLPSEFIIDQDGKVDIKTPIHHLPVTPEYRQTYGDIAHIFHSMLPLFEKLKLIKTNVNEEQHLQVIVKAQSYKLKAGMKYSGRWHTEGHTENIVAAGVYYLHVDDQLEGGALKFRPKYGPQVWYEGIKTDHNILSVETGAAIVFSNAIPHRFQQIRNLTRDDGPRRTFLNFFIVDPEQRIPLKSNDILFAPKNIIIDTLSKWNDGRLPVIALEKIFKFLNMSSAWDNESEAKEFRARVRRAMLDEKSGWGWICWGNCGTTEFVSSLCTWSPRDREEARDELHHTESD